MKKGKERSKLLKEITNLKNKTLRGNTGVFLLLFNLKLF